MATVYFSNNADSGDGSLRSAWTNASSGDVIMPDPTAFTGKTIEILLGANWTVKAATITLDGGNYRIILNGQDTYRYGTGSTAAAIHTYRNVDFKNFTYTGTGSTAVQYPMYLSNLGSLTYTNCSFYGNHCASGATSNFLRTTSISSASVTLNNCIAYDNGSAATSRFLQVNVGSFIINGCTFYSGINGTVTNNDSLLASAIDFSEAGFVDYSNNDFRLTPTSTYLTGGTLTGTDFLGHARNGSKGAYDGSWYVVGSGSSDTVSSDATIDYAEINGTVTFSGSNKILTISKEATIGSATFTAASNSNGYLVVPSGTNVSSATFSGVSSATYGAGVTTVTASVTERTCSFVITKTDSTKVVDCIEYQATGDSTWTKISGLTDNDASFTIATDKSFKLRTFDGANFVESTTVPRRYYYKGSSSSGSFATASDWAMDASKTMTCTSAPTIADCYFYCN